MKKAAVQLFILTGVLVLLASCAGVSLSRFQNDFDALYEQKEDCRSLAPKFRHAITKIESIPCVDEAEAKLFDLAQSAINAANDARDQRTRVALLRLAGVSLWQSGRGDETEGSAMLNQITSQGSSVCEALETEAGKKNVYGAPRDCAILTILPALVWHSAYFNQLEQLEKQAPTEETRTALEKIVRNYPANTVLFVSERETTAKSFTGLSESVKGYIQEVKVRSFCNYLKVEEIVLDKDAYQDLKPEVKQNITLMIEKTGIDRLNDCF